MADRPNSPARAARFYRRLAYCNMALNVVVLVLLWHDHGTAAAFVFGLAAALASGIAYGMKRRG